MEQSRSIQTGAQFLLAAPVLQHNGFEILNDQKLQVETVGPNTDGLKSLL